VGSVDEFLEVLKGTIVRVDIVIVSYVIPVVPKRGRIER